MFAPASVGGHHSPTEPLEALKLYSSLGLRSFPATYLDKTPHPNVGKWGALAERPPVPPDAWARLVEGWDRFNVALICDEHLVVIDLDNLDFVAWFDAQGPERLGTWIVRSPSGGLHIYAYSDDPQRTTVIKAASGLKIGDVKARGGYVIAPPSVGSNGDYQTEYGSPDAITRQANVVTWFSGFVAAWAGTQPVRLQPTMSSADGQPEYADTTIHGAPPAALQSELLAKLRAEWLGNRLNRKVYDTLLGGVDAAGNYWKNADDRSMVDFGCVKELINVGWTFPEIEELWTFAPVGERYCDRSARAHGHGYLLRTFDKAKTKWDAEQADLLFAVGPDWRLLNHVERWEEGRLLHYSFSLQSTTNGDVYAIEVDGRAFASPQEFKRAVYGRSAFIDLGNFSDAKGLRTLALAIQRLAVERPKPELATREGVLRAHIRSRVEERVLPRVVTQGDDLQAWLSWCDGPWVYADAVALQRSLRLALSPSPTANEIWAQWQRLNGEEARWPKTAYCWRAPRQSFPDLQLS